MKVKQYLKRLLRPGGNQVLKREQGWSIGIYSGSSPFTLSPHPACTSPVLTATDVTDTRAMFAADPFMIRIGDRWYLFFELWNLESKKGEIGLATSADATNWHYERIVLAEPFHLSYPYVFEWNGSCYMIPESHKARAVRLYRATDFPLRWELHATLLEGKNFVDPSPFRFRDRWWMYTETNPEYKHDTLRLYMADRLTGPWREHPRSPILRGDPHTARPGGRVLVENDGVVRFTQDCHPTYGSSVRAFRVTRLTPDEYEEEPVGEEPIVGPGGTGWNESGMHHVDAHRCMDGSWIACVDGFAWFERLVRAPGGR